MHVESILPKGTMGMKSEVLFLAEQPGFPCMLGFTIQDADYILM
jgi:hypothetical protein